MDADIYSHCSKLCIIYEVIYLIELCELLWGWKCILYVDSKSTNPFET